MNYDLIIIGGGLVGRSLAYALGQSSLKIALVDASEKNSPDPRLIALNYGNCCFLNKLGLWAELEQYSAPIHDVHVSHRGRFGITRLRAQDIHLPALGYVIPASRINQALERPLQTPSFTELRPAIVNDIQLDEQNIIIRIDMNGQGTEISGKLIIAADGANSSIRKLLNFNTHTFDYQQSAIVTTCTMAGKHRHTAYERFLEDGTLAMLPLKDEQNTLYASIWTASTEMISTLKLLDDTAFMQTLQTYFGYRLGRIQNISQRHVFPLQYIHVKNPIQGNVILMGNAAHTIHPIAAQGLNVALYEIAQFSQILLKRTEQLNPNWTSFLSQWQPQKNILFSHYLNQLFSTDFWGIPLARQLGMISLDLCLPAKRQMSRMLAMESMRWS